jgi:hypothetical protein
MRHISKGSFTMGRPQIGGRPQRLFRPIVEIVAKRRTNLRLEFQGRNQPSLVNDHEIPDLGRSKEARQGQKRTLALDRGFG